MKTRELYTVMFPSYPDIVDVAQMQKMLGVSRHLAYELITSGKVQGIKVGKAYRVPNKGRTQSVLCCVRRGFLLD